MVLMINQVTFPPEESHKVGEAYAQWLKDNPPPVDIEKHLCIAVSSTENGDVLCIGVAEVKKGKVKEDLMYNTKQNLFLASKIKGLKYKTTPMMSYQEAYKVLGMSAPEVQYVAPL